MGIKRVKLEDIRKQKGRTSKEELEKISDAEIIEAVLADEDAVMPTEEELKEFGKPKERGRKDEKEG